MSTNYTKTITLYTASQGPCSNGKTVHLFGTASEISTKLRMIEAQPGFRKWSQISEIDHGISGHR